MNLNEMYLALQSGNVEVVKKFLNYDSSAKCRIGKGENLLYEACQVNTNEKVNSTKRLAVLKLLWKNGAKVNERCGENLETALHLATRTEQVEVVNFLLRSGANANSRDRNERVPLHLLAAASHGDTKHQEAMLSFLLQRGANLHAQDARWRTPLIVAVCSENFHMVKLLLNAGAQINFQNRLGMSALFYASESHSVDMVDLLLQHGANPRLHDQRKRSTALHILGGGTRGRDASESSARSRTAAVARLLVQRGADPSAADAEGLTPLHVAAYTLHVELAEELLQLGAKLDVKEEFGNAPLHTLLMQSRVDDNSETRLERIAYLMINNDRFLNTKHELLKNLFDTDLGVDVNTQNENLETPLHYALWRGNANVVFHLLKQGANINILWYSDKGSLRFLHDVPFCNAPDICDRSTGEAFTALNVAAVLGHLEVIDVLLDQGENVNVSNFTGNHKIAKTPLYFAVKNHHYNVVKMLLESGCEVGRLVLHATTVLHVAASCDNRKIVYLLLEYGANTNLEDIHGKTPLRCAYDVKNNFTKEELYFIFVKYIAILKFERLQVNDKDLELIDSEKLLADYERKCKNELMKMKEEVVSGNLSMYSILTKNFNTLARCLNNKNIIHSFWSKFNDDRYPIYNEILKFHFDLSLERKHVIESGIVLLNEIFRYTMEMLGYQSIPDAIIEKVLNYFTERELRKVESLIKNNT